MNTNGSKTATVEALTAEVRVLMVGNRQVTLSVAKQLDHLGLDELEMFGRVRLPDGMRIIGRHTVTWAGDLTGWTTPPAQRVIPSPSALRLTVIACNERIY